MHFLGFDITNRTLVLIVVMLALLGFVALVTHTHHGDSDSEQCLACKITSSIWLVALFIVLVCISAQELPWLKFVQPVFLSRSLIPSGKRAPPCIS